MRSELGLDHRIEHRFTVARHEHEAEVLNKAVCECSLQVELELQRLLRDRIARAQLPLAARWYKWRVARSELRVLQLWQQSH